MKTEEEIRNNLNAKLEVYLGGFSREQKLIEHIRMLDWVLNDGMIRKIEEIVKEKAK